MLQAAGVTCTVSRGNDTLTVVRERDGEPTEKVVLQLLPLAESLIAKYHDSGISNVPPDSMMVEAAAGRLRVKAYVLNLQVTKEEVRPRIDWIRIRVLVGDATDE
jgi:hypothetical protein